MAGTRRVVGERDPDQFIRSRCEVVGIGLWALVRLSKAEGLGSAVVVVS